jgi:hypothetical protein
MESGVAPDHLQLQERLEEGSAQYLGEAAAFGPLTVQE